MALTREQIAAKFSIRKIILPIVLGLGVIGYILCRKYEPDQLQTLLQASPFWLSMSFPVLFVRDFGYIYHIRYITEKVQGWKQRFRVVLLREFASYALPSVAGGSTIASYMLYKEGVPLGNHCVHEGKGGSTSPPLLPLPNHRHFKNSICTIPFGS